MKAREIIVAPRVPPLPKNYTGLVSEGDVYAECDTCVKNGGRVYQVMGPRKDVVAALKDHHRVFHPDQTGVVLLNAPRQ